MGGADAEAREVFDIADADCPRRSSSRLAHNDLDDAVWDDPSWLDRGWWRLRVNRRA
jgi:hypothetical protein